MDISTIKAAIDIEVSTRSSGKFAIKVGGELYKELAKAGFIKLATFSAFGTGAFPQEFPAYEGKYYIFCDWELDDYAFKVGNPAS
jgi:hypothetical protein